MASRAKQHIIGCFMSYHTSLHGVVTQKTVTWIFIVDRSSSLTSMADVKPPASSTGDQNECATSVKKTSCQFVWRERGLLWCWVAFLFQHYGLSTGNLGSLCQLKSFHLHGTSPKYSYSLVTQRHWLAVTKASSEDFQAQRIWGSVCQLTKPLTTWANTNVQLTLEILQQETRLHPGDDS